MKKHTVYFWIATVIIFLFEGLMPISTLIFSPENFNLGTKPLGYPDYFAYALIICKFAGTSAIIIPGIPPIIKEWAYAGLTFNLLFATFSHIVVDKNISFILMPVVVGIILAVSYVNYHRLNRNWQRQTSIA